jgi:2,3-dihydroxybenzoate decarboxylase
MPLIALEEHFVMNDPLQLDRWRSMVTMIPETFIEELLPVLTDVGDRRLEAMSRAGIDVAVLSNAGSVQGVVDPTLAMRLAREANDYLAAVVQKHPTRYAGFATVPLQNPTAGADELERAVKQLGMKGAMLFGTTNGEYLDHDRFTPFWERVEALDCPIYLHAADAPIMPVGLVGRPELLGATWSWTAETATHALRLVMGGVFDRHPGVRVILGHMGETLPYLLWRLDRRTQAFSASGKPPAKPSDLIKRNIVMTTAGVCSDTSLTCALDSVGTENVMFSVDHPFESMDDSSAWLNAAPVSNSQREALSWRNAQRILKLDVPQHVSTVIG